MGVDLYGGTKHSTVKAMSVMGSRRPLYGKTITYGSQGERGGNTSDLPGALVRHSIENE
jgi:hypothetical protein